jgi:hypothetical protein
VAPNSSLPLKSETATHAKAAVSKAHSLSPQEIAMTTASPTLAAAPSGSADSPYPGSVFVGFNVSIIDSYHYGPISTLCRRRSCARLDFRVSSMIRRGQTKRLCDRCGNELT